MPTHWKKLTNPNYLGSWDFKQGEEKIFTIARVSGETIKGSDGKEDDCPVVYFTEKTKPLVLNHTNGKMISKLFGSPNIEDWEGRQIALHVEKIKAFGDVVEAVRVVNKHIAPKAVNPATICEDCKKEITDKDGFSAETIIAGAKKRYGVPLCMDCATKRKVHKEEVERLKAELDAESNAGMPPEPPEQDPFPEPLDDSQEDEHA